MPSLLECIHAGLFRRIITLTLIDDSVCGALPCMGLNLAPHYSATVRLERDFQLVLWLGINEARTYFIFMISFLSMEEELP